MFFVKFIRKDLDFLSTARAFADKRCQIFKLFETRTVFRSGHSSLLKSSPAALHPRGMGLFLQFFQHTNEILKSGSLVDIMDVDITEDSLFINHKQGSFRHAVRS